MTSEKRKLRTDVFDKWLANSISKNINSVNGMEELHNHYSSFSENQNSIPFKRKYFAFLLRKNFLKELQEGSILIYYETKTLIKGIEINQ